MVHPVGQRPGPRPVAQPFWRHRCHLDAHRPKAIGHIAKAVGTRLLIMNYRRSPEHKFPAQIDDVEKAYRWLVTQRIRPANIASIFLLRVVTSASSSSGWTPNTNVALPPQTLFRRAEGKATPNAKLILFSDAGHRCVAQHIGKSASSSLRNIGAGRRGLGFQLADFHSEARTDISVRCHLRPSGQIPLGTPMPPTGRRWSRATVIPAISGRHPRSGERRPLPSLVSERR